MRLFAALDLPAAILEDLEMMCQGVPGVRWVPPESMHITLRFIGEVTGHVREDIFDALGTVRAQPFELTLKGVGHFESGRRPRVLWVGVQRNPGLLHLQHRVEAAIQRAGLEPEGRKFRPHVTLARIKEDPGPRLPIFLADHNLYESRPFPVDSFTLFSSFLSKNGAIHRPEADFPFDKPLSNAEEEDDWSGFNPWSAQEG